ncbi:MAG: nitroreductase family protein [Thermomicrobiales bacterium]|nr:nitroreductase family protein [Thermomicrobiales bacterium]
MTTLPAPTATSVTELLAQRRSIRRLAGGALSPETVAHLQGAVLRTPSAFGVTPWRIVILHEQLDTFWDEVAAGFRNGLSGDRLDRYLDRLSGFRHGAGVILIYEDLGARPALRLNWGLSEQTAYDFVQQGLGMVQLALWLVLTEAGLATSLQHWDWLIQDRLASLLDLPTDRYRLVSTLPGGAPAEPPRAGPTIGPAQVISVNPDLRQSATRAGARP